MKKETNETFGECNRFGESGEQERLDESVFPEKKQYWYRNYGTVILQKWSS